MVDVDGFFEAVERVGKANPVLDASRETALATVDPNYTGTGAVRVTFDGENTLATKAYPYLLSVSANQRVLLLRSGHSWVILGPLKGV